MHFISLSNYLKTLFQVESLSNFLCFLSLFTFLLKGRVVGGVGDGMGGGERERERESEREGGAQRRSTSAFI